MSSLSEWIRKSDLDQVTRGLILQKANMVNDDDFKTFIYPNTEHIGAIKKAEKPSDKNKLIYVLLIKTANIVNGQSVEANDGSTFTAKDGENKTIVLVNNSNKKRFTLSKKTEDPDGVWRLDGNDVLIGDPLMIGNTSITGGLVDQNFSPSGGLNKLIEITTKIECEYGEALLTKNTNMVDPYLGAIASFLRYLELNHKNVLENIIPLMDINPMISFYIILQPYKTNPPYLVPRECIFDNNGTPLVTLDSFGFSAGKTYEAFLSWQPNKNEADKAKVFNAQKNIKAEVAKLCEQLCAAMSGTNKPSAELLVGSVKDLYERLRKENKIGQLSNILPNTNIFGLDQLLWIDEFRFWANEFLIKLEGNAKKFTQMVCGIRQTFPGNNFTDELTVHNINTDQCGGSSLVVEFAIDKFLKSKLFMHFGYTRDQVTTGGVGYASRMSNVNGISSRTLNELKLYVRSHGKLPPAVTDLL
jgi:thymidine kinase